MASTRCSAAASVDEGTNAVCFHSTRLVSACCQLPPAASTLRPVRVFPSPWGAPRASPTQGCPSSTRLRGRLLSCSCDGWKLTLRDFMRRAECVRPDAPPVAPADAPADADRASSGDDAPAGPKGGRHERTPPDACTGACTPGTLTACALRAACASCASGSGVDAMALCVEDDAFAFVSPSWLRGGDLLTTRLASR